MNNPEDDSSQDHDIYEEPEWTEYRAHLEDEEEQANLQAKDYLALFIAALETIFLPLILMMIVFFAFGVIFFLLG